MTAPLHLALYQPEIPDNTAALLRLSACLNIHLHLIEPLGFALNSQRMRRITLDYAAQVQVTRHASFNLFHNALGGARLVLATTKAENPYWSHDWQASDVLLMGQESAGVPHAVHEVAACRLTIPMAPPARSLNLASAATLICGDWHRQRNLAL